MDTTHRDGVRSVGAQPLLAEGSGSRQSVGALFVTDGLIPDREWQTGRQPARERGSKVSVGQMPGERPSHSQRPRTVVLGHSQAPYQLGALLVAQHVITESQLQIALDHHRKTGLRLGDALLQLHFVSQEELGHLLEWLFLAEQRRTPSAPSVAAEPSLLQRVSAVVRRAVDGCRGLRVRELGAWHPARRG